jgi:hypothetical protein
MLAFRKCGWSAWLGPLIGFAGVSVGLLGIVLHLGLSSEAPPLARAADADHERPDHRGDRERERR